MDYLAIRDSKSSFMEAYGRKINEAILSLQTRSHGAIEFQRLYRGSKARAIITFKSNKANEIQRVYRGHASRLRANQLKYNKFMRRSIRLREYFILQLQRVFRGYYSRKFKANHKNRKAFIKHILTTAETVRAQMDAYVIEQKHYENMSNLNKRDEEFKLYAKNLHHLVSTKQIRGVFNPLAQYMDVPTVDDIPVEDHIRGAVKDLLKTRGITKSIKDCIPDLNGTLVVPLKGLKHKLSMQASAPYDAVQQEKRRATMLHKILTRGKEIWQAGGKTKVLEDKYVPMSTGDTYFDPYANPMLMRGIPESQKQFHEIAYTRKPLFIKQLEKPFYTRAEGNKSTVLPNDLFDSIAEAQETGGVTHRNLGTSVRFGVPDNCDNRPVSIAPPARASTFRAARPIVKNTIVIKARANTAPMIIETEDNSNNNNGDEEEKQRAYPYDSSDDEI